MWTRLNKNLFTLDFSQFININNKLTLPNINDDFVSYDISEYNMVKNEYHYIKTYHGISTTSNAAITVHDTHIEIFVIDINNESYTIKVNDKNEYVINKSEDNQKKGFSCQLKNRPINNTNKHKQTKRKKHKNKNNTKT